MRHGLQPTQRDEWKDKHKIRYFFEERVLEIQYLSVYVLSLVSNAYDSISSARKKIDKRIAIQVLLAILIAAIIAM